MLSPYQYRLNNPVNKSDSNGDCPNCITAAIGAVIGGGIAVAMQMYRHGEVKDWNAVSGAAVQVAITGGVAGLAGGASLLATTSASAGANVMGGIANRAIQGKETTAKDISPSPVSIVVSC